MMERYALLATRIRLDLEDLERVVNRIATAMAYAQGLDRGQDFYLDSVALNMHGFYAGLERAFRRIAAMVDGSVPEGDSRHQDILAQMGADLPGVRPPVLSPECMKELSEFLRFRRVVRNIYAFKFDPERLERLSERLGPAFQMTKAELLVFADFLDELAQ
jgi:hypothetical protein